MAKGRTGRTARRFSKSRTGKVARGLSGYAQLPAVATEYGQGYVTGRLGVHKSALVRAGNAGYRRGTKTRMTHAKRGSHQFKANGK